MGGQLALKEMASARELQSLKAKLAASHAKIALNKKRIEEHEAKIKTTTETVRRLPCTSFGLTVALSPPLLVLRPCCTWGPRCLCHVAVHQLRALIPITCATATWAMHLFLLTS